MTPSTAKPNMPQSRSESETVQPAYRGYAYEITLQDIWKLAREHSVEAHIWKHEPIVTKRGKIVIVCLFEYRSIRTRRIIARENILWRMPGPCTEGAIIVLEFNDGCGASA